MFLYIYLNDGVVHATSKNANDPRIETHSHMRVQYGRLSGGELMTFRKRTWRGPNANQCGCHIRANVYQHLAEWVKVDMVCGRVDGELVIL